MFRINLFLKSQNDKEQRNRTSHWQDFTELMSIELDNFLSVKTVGNEQALFIKLKGFVQTYDIFVILYSVIYSSICIAIHSAN